MACRSKLSHTIFPIFSIMSWFSIVALALSISTAAATNFQVDVGKDLLTFTPETINAQAGDTVTYSFHPKVLLTTSFKQARLVKHTDCKRITLLLNPPSQIHAIPWPVVFSQASCQPLTSHPAQLLPLMSMTQNQYGYTVVKQLEIIVRREWFTPLMRMSTKFSALPDYF